MAAEPSIIIMLKTSPNIEKAPSKLNLLIKLIKYTNNPDKLKQPIITSLAEFLGSMNKIVIVGRRPISKTITAGKNEDAIIAKKINNRLFLAIDND